jgi:peptidoglycan/LPS O-acetylase OafA/YrhL
MIQKTRTKLDALTGLRIVAASMIVLHHSSTLQIPMEMDCDGSFGWIACLAWGCATFAERIAK